MQAERQAAEAVAAAEALPLMRPAVSGTPLAVAALADDDLSTAARHVHETRALLPHTIVFWPPFLGSFYGVAAVVRAAAGAGELVEGTDWAPHDDVYQHSSFCVARAIVAGRAGEREQADALFAEGDQGLVEMPWVRAMYRRYAAEAALADGLTNKEIASRLYLSPRTVEKHVERILTKTGQDNRTALAAFATVSVAVAPARSPARRTTYERPRDGHRK